MQSRGRFVGDLAGTSDKGGGGMGLSPLLMMLMMNGGGGKMVALMPFLLQNGGNWVTWVVTVLPAPPWQKASCHSTKDTTTADIPPEIRIT